MAKALSLPALYLAALAVLVGAYVGIPAEVPFQLRGSYSAVAERNALNFD